MARKKGRRRYSGPTPKREWIPMRRIPLEELGPDYLGSDVADTADEFWINDRYECRVIKIGDGEDRLRHISINRLDRRPMRNWRHLQQIKNEVCGELWTGIELFPPEDRLVDSANQYHLSCFPPEVDLSYLTGRPGEGIVSDDDQVEQWNGEDHPGRQEPWEPGLTTGRTEHSAAARRRLSERDGQGS